jgi:flagellar hook-associated protein 3 FlgL
MGRLAWVENYLLKENLNLAEQLSRIEDVDLEKVIMELQLEQTAYETALTLGSSILQPSLFHFLR